jgi:putative transposase
MDITYLPIQCVFIYLWAVIDWCSRAALAWGLSNTLDADFCVAKVARATSKHGAREIINTDQAWQLTLDCLTRGKSARELKLSMDGRGLALDIVFAESALSQREVREG